MKLDDRIALVTLSIDMHFAPGTLREAVHLLSSIVEPTEAKAGCRECSVTRNAADESRIHYSESWNSEDPFRRHAQSGEFQRVLMAMDMCLEEPQVIVGNLSGHGGIKHLEKILET